MELERDTLVRRKSNCVTSREIHIKIQCCHIKPLLTKTQKLLKNRKGIPHFKQPMSKRKTQKIISCPKEKRIISKARNVCTFVSLTKQKCSTQTTPFRQSEKWCAEYPMFVIKMLSCDLNWVECFLLIYSPTFFFFFKNIQLTILKAMLMQFLSQLRLAVCTKIILQKPWNYLLYSILIPKYQSHFQSKVI